MRSILIIFTFLSLTIAASAQDKASAEKTVPKTVLNKVVEASCGQCRFNMAGKSCDLAVKIDGKAYFVDGTGIDEHGDAHAKDGFCQKVRKARVSGHIEGNRFKATSFKLLPEENNN
ncbi:hypothetical protein GZH53_16680 [Flavihumibacter sp. R14]|nr:hypothetical protein [Flavihumibacter soli]